MRCYACGHDKFSVLYSIPLKYRNTTARRKECLSCKARITTHEYIVKKGNERQPKPKDIEFGE